jgi:hypothetical protein
MRITDAGRTSTTCRSGGGLVACVKFIDDVVLEFVLLSFKER